MKEKRAFYSILALLFLAWFVGMLLPTVPLGMATPNQTVLTKVNVSNTEPRIINVTVVPTTITLNPGTTTNVYCNATVWDYNGVPGSIKNVTAILYLNSTSIGAATKNDTKYFSVCTNVSTISTTMARYFCNFSVWYFARNGTWTCNVTAIDNGDLNGTGANITVIQPLIAINVSDVIDYGQVPVLNTSDEREANLTNFGNVPINISVRGWGGQNESLYPNVSMICEFGGNISLDMQRYNITTGQTWDNMINLTGQDRLISGLFVNPRNDTFIPLNKTYWRIKIPSGVGGLCNGTLLFTASNY